MNFQDKLEKAIVKNNSLVCVGLDPEKEKVGKQSLFDFNKRIIDQTADLVCAYKPNIAFYEAAGVEGLRQLKKTINYLKKNYPKIPVILDAKRGDVPNTARLYAKACFEYWDVDAVTVNPNLGLDSIRPFLEYENKLTILLVKTSNPDAKIFQDLKVNSESYYLVLAKEIKRWPYTNIGFFVGATYPKNLEEIRRIFPDKIILSAGFGSQKANIKEAVISGIDQNKRGVIFNVSRAIIYDQNPKKTAQRFKDEINKYR